jgi:pimeloyl-ACP methyl ester carboxylesterase
VFDVSAGGLESAPLVLMLHGFCVSRYFWDNQIPVLTAAGYFAVAPNQRGYAVDARPDPADFDNNRIDRLIGDAVDVVREAGHGDRQFHLVGHDWGGSLSWIIADRWPERIASLTMLSRPHPASFARAMKNDPEQPNRSRHHLELLDSGAGPRLLAENGKWVRDRLARNGVPQMAIDKHLSVIGNQSAMEAALAWYRARGERQPIGQTKVTRWSIVASSRTCRLRIRLGEVMIIRILPDRYGIPCNFYAGRVSACIGRGGRSTGGAGSGRGGSSMGRGRCGSCRIGGLPSGFGFPG